jgi:hypothetical protein
MTAGRISAPMVPRAGGFGQGAASLPGSRTPNPLIVGLICSTLLVAVQNCPLTWAFVVRSWIVAAARFLMLPVESRPVSRAGSPSCCVPRSAIAPIVIVRPARSHQTIFRLESSPYALCERTWGNMCGYASQSQAKGAIHVLHTLHLTLGGAKRRETATERDTRLAGWERILG